MKQFKNKLSIAVDMKNSLILKMIIPMLKKIWSLKLYQPQDYEKMEVTKNFMKAEITQLK